MNPGSKCTGSTKKTLEFVLRAIRMYKQNTNERRSSKKLLCPAGLVCCNGQLSSPNKKTSLERPLSNEFAFTDPWSFDHDEPEIAPIDEDF